MQTARSNPLSYNAALVLQAVAQGHAYGFDLMRVTGLPSGTVYPLLRRLEAAGLVASDWEDEHAAHADGRPPRRHYRLTPAAEPALFEATQRVLQQRRLFEAGEGDGVPVAG